MGTDPPRGTQPDVTEPGDRGDLDPDSHSSHPSVRKGVVVTEELRSGNLTKPKIPDVCDALGVPCLNLVGFVRAQGWTF